MNFDPNLGRTPVSGHDGNTLSPELNLDVHEQEPSYVLDVNENSTAFTTDNGNDYPTEDETNAIVEGQMSPELDAGLPVWNCHRCAESELGAFMNGCPNCFHTRCKWCPTKWKPYASAAG